MKKYFLFFIIIMVLALSGCNKTSQPTSSIHNDTAIASNKNNDTAAASPTQNSNEIAQKHFETAMQLFKNKEKDFSIALYNWNHGIENWDGADLEYEDIVKVREELTKALEKDPNFAKAHVERGKMFILSDAYYMEGNAIDLAEEDFTKAIELDPKNAEAYLFRATCHSFWKEQEKVLADINKAIALDPNYAYAYSVRSSFYDFQHDDEKAKADEKKATELGMVRY